MTDIPQLFPEELLHGYRGRIRLINGLRDGNAVNAWLNGRKTGNRGHASRERSFVDLVAEHNGCTMRHVVMQHSLWPFTAAVDRPDSAEEIEELADRQSGRTAMLRVARREAWFCRSCVDEDLAFWGVAYWRRNHQLPGVMWCDKHETPLHHASLNRIEAGPPDHSLIDAETTDAAWVDELRSNPTLRCFLEIGSVILEAQLRLDRRHCVGAIRRGVPEEETCATSEGIEVALVRAALERLPVGWLSATFPRVLWQQPDRVGVFCTAFRRHFQAYPLSTASLALAAALTFGTLERSLVELGARGANGAQAAPATRRRIQGSLSDR